VGGLEVARALEEEVQAVQEALKDLRRRVGLGLVVGQSGGVRKGVRGALGAHREA